MRGWRPRLSPPVVARLASPVMPDAPSADPADLRPARRVPNCTMTEADWGEAMRLFLEERWSDARIARRFNLSPSTVSAQRFKRGSPRPEA